MASGGDALAADAIRSMRIPELKDNLRLLNLPTIGRKAELIERLLNATGLNTKSSHNAPNSPVQSPRNETIKSIHEEITKLENELEVIKLELQVKETEAALHSLRCKPVCASSPNMSSRPAVDEIPLTTQASDNALPSRGVDRARHTTSFVPSNSRTRNPSSQKVKSVPIGQQAPTAPDQPVAASGGPSKPKTTDVIQLLAESLALSRLPVPEPPLFSGDPMMYPEWNQAFRTLIEQRAQTDADCLYYLKRYVRGPALDAISGFLSGRSDKAYEEAKAVLDRRYGTSFHISEAYRKRLETWEKIAPKDGQALRKFADFLSQCLSVKDDVSELAFLDDSHQNQRLLQLLPDYLVSKWNSYVVEFEHFHQHFPPFAEFVSFMQKEANIACHPITSLEMVRKKRQFNLSKVNSISHNINSHTPIYTMQKCPICAAQHHVGKCPEFLRLSITERFQTVTSRQLCFNCLKEGHQGKRCRSNYRCSKCNGRHHTLIHRDSSTVSNDRSGPMDAINCGNVHSIRPTTSRCLCSMIVPVWISSKSNKKQRWLTYAMLDTQSDATFMTEEVASKIKGIFTSTTITLSTMTSKDKVIRCKKYTDLIIQGYFEDTELQLPSTYTRQFIPHNRDHIPSKHMTASWPHLKTIENKIEPPTSCSVGLLIGYNCPDAIVATQIIQAQTNQPYGVKTKLGWSIVGQWSDSVPDHVDYIGVSHRLMCLEVPLPLQLSHSVMNKTLVSCKTKIREQQFQADEIFRQLEGDLIPLKPTDWSSEMSQEDIRFIKILESSIKQESDGFYTMPLPFKENKPVMPSNRSQVLNRFRRLQRKMNQNPQFSLLYHEFMSAIISSGEAELVPESELDAKEVWYLPHHGVFNSKKPGKIRVVFDGSVIHEGHCLNNYLLQGPNLNSSLVAVLTRFRLHHVALSCDIKKMFHQFRVDKSCRDFLRFFWFHSKHPNLVAEYRMTVHIFGAASSPSCAKFGLNQVVLDHGSHVPRVVSFVKTNFYVDDGLSSCPSITEAVELLKDTQQILSLGNLTLHKIVANNLLVLNQFSDSQLATADCEMLESQALGVRWLIKNDKFAFDPPSRPQSATRRNMLSSIASFFDPLGLLSPILLEGKLILQCISKGLDWDDLVSEPISTQWNKWLANTTLVSLIRVDRCLQPLDFGTIASAEIHTFADASSVGYGCCSYLRLINTQGKIHNSLIYSKSRVIPSSKKLTIPRLELLAAVLAARVGSTLSQEINFKVNEYYYTDSQIVLSYIRNSIKKFHVFVANRIAQIVELTPLASWRYVEGCTNPADIASRGMNAKQLLDSIWFVGPSFLWERFLSEDKTPSIPLSNSDPEIKSFSHATKCSDTNVVLEHVNYFSKWTSEVKFALLILHILKHRWKVPISTPTVESLRSAENWLISLHQKAYFEDELELISNKRALSNSSRIWRFNPFIDEDGLLRVGGRIKLSNFVSDLEKFPVILSKGHVSKLIVLHFHNVSHQGRDMTMAAVRAAGYWILNLRQIASSLIYSCVMCRSLRRPLEIQRMSDLPPERLEPSPPFTYVGLDCFGPFLVRDGRKTHKKYGLILVCMASRAIHVELLDDMSSDCFINSLRSFIALRGPVRQIRCDQGTNFVGAANEFKRAYNEMSSKLKDYLLKHSCDFVFNTPCSSHMGGAWERLIRTFRNVLHGVVGKTMLDSSSIRTVFYEVMSIVNSRPLTTVEGEVEPLTPNHLLHQKSGIVFPPPGQFSEEDTYSRKRWRKVQGLVHMFWNRWKSQYLISLQARSKWTGVRRNIRIDDIVLLQEESIRTEWRLGRIVEVMPSSDGLVRKVKVLVGARECNAKTTVLERPVHKLVVLIESSANIN